MIPENKGVVLYVKGRKRKKRNRKREGDREGAVEQWSGRKRRGTNCEQEDGVTAANQISLSLGCLMSILLCDSHLTTLSTMNTRSTRFSIVPLLCSQIREGCIGMKHKRERGRKRSSGKEERRDAGDSLGKFDSYESVADHRILPSNTQVSLRQKDVFPPVPHSLSLGRSSVFLSLCLYNTRFPLRLQWFRAQLNIFSTEAQVEHS